MGRGLPRVAPPHATAHLQERTRPQEAVAGPGRRYHSPLVQQIRANGHRYESGRLIVRLAAEFGFCYGVDRAVDYAYQARTRFPDRTVFLTGEIIHNPHVNDQLRGLGIRFLSDPGEDAADSVRTPW